MAPTVTRLDAAGNTQLGEGPHWDPKTKSLYFIDIEGGTLHRYCPATNTSAVATVEGKAGCCVSLIIPIKGKPNQFVISVNRELGIATWDGKSNMASYKPLIEVDAAADVCENRINDGKCDASGRIWFGTIGVLDTKTMIWSNNASFYSLPNGKAKHQFGEVSISNGLAWNKSNTKFYYIDTPTQRIDVFDFDLTTGTISNRKTLAELPKLGIVGGPDGMTIDTDDNLWVAVFDGGCVLQICTKDGSLLQKVELPAKQITSMVWGGDNLDELYVTCARIFNPAYSAPVHGAIYKITGLGAKGFEMNEAVL